MSTFEIQRMRGLVMSIQKEVEDFKATVGATSGVSMDDITREVQAAYIRMMVSVDTGMADVRGRLDDLDRKVGDLVVRMEKMEATAVPKLAKAAEIMARLDKLEAAAAAAGQA